jgi:nucleoside phosphorylase
VVALEVERRVLQRRLVARAPGAVAGFPAVRGSLAGRPVVLVQAGLGGERARDAAWLTATRLSCRSVWSLGLAGGLDPRLETGALLLPAAVLPSGGPRLACAASHAVRRALLPLCAHDGALASVSAAVLSRADKAALFAATGACAADMEAAGVALAAERLGLPWLALKVVLDPAGMALPPLLLRGARADGSLRPAGMLPALWRPAALGQVLRFARRSRRALRRLADAAEQALGAWPP